MEIIQISTIAIVGVLLAVFLKSINKDFSVYVVLATSIIIILLVIDKLSAVFMFMEDLYDNVTYGKTFFPIIIKVIAVAYITDFTGQLCKDAGETSIGSKLEIAGKVIIFYLAMPILSAILELIASLIDY